MPSHAQRMLALRVLIGTLWAGFVFIAGLSIAARYANQLRGAEDVVRFIGVALAALGMFIFCCVVADRVFPRADPRLCAAIRLLFGVIPVAAVIYVAAFLIRYQLEAA